MSEALVRTQYECDQCGDISWSIQSLDKGYVERILKKYSKNIKPAENQEEVKYEWHVVTTCQNCNQHNRLYHMVK